MQTSLAPLFKNTRDGQEAEAILRKCVHCGYCNATCPTFQVLGNELDGPRGRIYLIKQVLEGTPATQTTQLHLDRCLTCLSCETSCPSGVRYGALVEIGRKVVDVQVERPRLQRALRWILKNALLSPFFAIALRIGQVVRPLLPKALKAKVPALPAPAAGTWTRREHPRKMLMLAGCVQPAMAPNINRATMRVLDAAGIEAVVEGKAGCCGAIRTHMGDADGGLADMRRNIDAWWPLVASRTVEAIIMNASACGVMVKEYGHALANDPAYAAKAARISELTHDLSELLPELVPALKEKVHLGSVKRLAFHPPCTLLHGLKLKGGVEEHLGALGFEVQVPRSESYMCCGSAGTYSVLQPELSYELRDRKLGHLAALKPDCVVSANVGCITHLQSGTTTPVKHWVEVLDEALTADRR